MAGNFDKTDLTVFSKGLVSVRSDPWRVCNFAREKYASNGQGVMK